jgi:hypothetical protein
MANNLFFLKGWTITLVSALFAFSAKESEIGYGLLSFLIVFIFWSLDGYFLSQERLFRDLYDDVRKLDEKDINFSMNIEKYKAYYRNSWISAMCSSSLLCFYPLLVASMLLVITLIK